MGFVVLLAMAAPAPAAVRVNCQGMHSSGPDRSRLTIDASGPIAHEIFTLTDPDRLVLDIPDARMGIKLPHVAADDPLVVGLRSGVRPDGVLRIVVDLKRMVRARSSLVSLPGSSGERLLVDLRSRQAGAPRAMLSSSADYPAAQLVRERRKRVARVAIDAGHGGKDPGAIGPDGTREKDVTLAIAKRLKSALDRTPGLEGFLVRKDDRFIALAQRRAIARAGKADLFVSIHADAAPDRSAAHGASVYTLSHGSASSEAAKLLANRENRVDLIGGIDLARSDDMLASVLLDMTQNATSEHSSEAATALLTQLARVGDLHATKVQRAGFVVLKSPDIPSVLVETAFISNPQEAERLRNSGHQQRLARAILSGIKTFFRKYPAHGFVTVEASGGSRRTGSAAEYVIVSGDTLSTIAQRHKVSLSALCRANGLKIQDPIRVGQVLEIPSDS